MDDKSFQYHLVEYGCLREELSQNAKNSYNIIVYSIIANAAIVAWILTNIDPASRGYDIIRPAALISLFISLISWHSYLARRNVIAAIGEYCCQIEDCLAAENLGWDHFYAARVKKRRERGVHFGGFWLSNVICITHVILAAYFLYFVVIRS